MANQAENKEKATKTTTKAAKTEVKAVSTPVKKAVAPKTTTPKAAVKPTVKVETPKVETPKIEVPKIEAPKAPKEKSTMEKVIDAGKTTSKIVTRAGTKIIGSSIETTKTIAGIYKKAGKKAFELGKELLTDTSKVVAKNRKNVRDTSVQAFKETVETIKDSNIIENPLKGMMKSKKK